VASVVGSSGPQGRAIVVVRHGETEWSAAGKHTSRTDLGLLEAGRARARELAAELSEWDFALVLCSPLRRARETCELAGYADGAQICGDLREWDYGEYEGLTTAQIRARNPAWNLWRDGCPGGELPAQVQGRADRVLERLREADGSALTFAHGHILRVLTARWISMGVSGGARFALSAGGIGVLGHEHEYEVVRRWSI
jgi:broad specificity phosphatase PhoE